MSVSTASNGAINIYLTGGAQDRAEKLLAGLHVDTSSTFLSLRFSVLRRCLRAYPASPKMP